jgi:uncharacterized membrane protein YcaP (DUF421 family)
MENGEIDSKALKRNHLNEQDLDSVARKYGLFESPRPLIQSF